MAEKKFFNKYPYTDFHEMNLDWIVNKTEDCVEAVEEMDARVTTAEADIDTIQESAIMDAQMLHSVSLVAQNADNVSLSFRKAIYTDGAQTTFGYDLATLPARNDTKAGVMLPEDKAKLDVFNVSGSDVTFPGDISAAGDISATGDVSVGGDLSVTGSATLGADPSQAMQAATKQYVDSLTITPAAPSLEDAIGDDGTDWATDETGLTVADTTNTKAGVYGYLRQYSGVVTLDGDAETELTIAAGTLIASCTLSPTLFTDDYLAANALIVVPVWTAVTAKNYHIDYAEWQARLDTSGEIKIYTTTAISAVKVRSIYMRFVIPAML